MRAREGIGIEGLMAKGSRVDRKFHTSQRPRSRESRMMELGVTGTFNTSGLASYSFQGREHLLNAL